jgi:hypothetical protein
VDCSVHPYAAEKEFNPLYWRSVNRKPLFRENEDSRFLRRAARTEFQSVLLEALPRFPEDVSRARRIL